MDQTLYEIAEEFEQLLELLDKLTDPDNPAARIDEEIDPDSINEAMDQAFEDIEMSLNEKTENIIRLLQSWDVMASMIRAEEVRLAERRKSYVNKQVRLKQYLARHLARTGIKKVETPIKNAYLYAGKPSVVIDDEMALPQGTFDTELVIKPDKNLIKARLDKKIETPGAHIETGDDFVVLR